MSTIVAIGVDPGPTPGLVRLVYIDSKLTSVSVIQCTADLVSLAFQGLFVPFIGRRDTQVYFQVERFVIGRGSYRSGSPGAVTRDMVGQLLELAAAGDVIPTQRSAVATKAWASDHRLQESGIAQYVKGMRHAKDAARHALQTAVAEGNIPDPLSKRSRKNV